MVSNGFQVTPDMVIIDYTLNKERQTQGIKVSNTLMSFMVTHRDDGHV